MSTYSNEKIGIRVLKIAALKGGIGMSKIRKNYKDGVFRKLFADKEKLIELYNALSGSDYSLDTELEIVTLDNSIFGDLKNDLAFVIDNKFIILVEHQSTVNPNMPLRMLIYLAQQYEKLCYSNEIYSRRRIYIPVPEFYVFYNGLAEIPIEEELKLSDAFICKCDKIPLEVIVKVINVNYEKGAELLARCRTLNEYSRFIYLIRKKARDMKLQQAVEKTIDECVREGLLKDFLKKNGGEIMSILCHELTREECEAIRENDGYLRGLEEGEAKGEARGEAKGEAKGRKEEKRAIAQNFKLAGLPLDIIAENTGLTIEEVEKL